MQTELLGLWESHSPAVIELIKDLVSAALIIAAGFVLSRASRKLIAKAAAGSLNVDDAAKALSLGGLAPDHDDYHTLAGFVLSLAGELPRTGDSFTYQGFRFQVIDMDGNRIDKLLISKEKE